MPEQSESLNGLLPVNTRGARIVPQVSIIIPIYNRGHLLSYALDSIRNQTFKEWEIIIVDDGSDDDSYDLIKKFAATIKQDISYFYQQNQGVAIARNNGIKRIRCEYVAFLDSDDRWFEDHLEILINIIQNNKDIDWICSDMQSIKFGNDQVIKNSKFYSEPNYQKIKKLNRENRDNIFGAGIDNGKVIIGWPMR
jgi:glycosyltransferase involved in cell wall biosynthesis